MPFNAVQFVLFAISSGGAISFSDYILEAAGSDSGSGSWLERGIAVVAISGKTSLFLCCSARARQRMAEE